MGRKQTTAKGTADVTADAEQASGAAEAAPAAAEASAPAGASAPAETTPTNETTAQPPAEQGAALPEKPNEAAPSGAAEAAPAAAGADAPADQQAHVAGLTDADVAELKLVGIDLDVLLDDGPPGPEASDEKRMQWLVAACERGRDILPEPRVLPTFPENADVPSLVSTDQLAALALELEALGPVDQELHDLDAIRREINQARAILDKHVNRLAGLLHLETQAANDRREQLVRMNTRLKSVCAARARDAAAAARAAALQTAAKPSA